MALAEALANQKALKDEIEAFWRQRLATNPLIGSARREAQYEALREAALRRMKEDARLAVLTQRLKEADRAVEAARDAAKG